jgi:hypothetical protein
MEFFYYLYRRFRVIKEFLSRRYRLFQVIIEFFYYLYGFFRVVTEFFNYLYRFFCLELKGPNFLFYLISEVNSLPPYINLITNYRLLKVRDLRGSMVSKKFIIIFEAINVLYKRL